MSDYSYLDKSSVDKEIKNRFPEAVTLSKKDPTYEELRKLIILLSSYIFWYKMQQIKVDHL